MEETPTDGKQLPGVDRETRLRLIPEAGSDERVQMRPPLDVRGVGPDVEVGRHLTERHPLRQTRQVKPPQQISKAVRGLRYRGRLVHLISRLMKTKLERPHAQPAPSDEVSQGVKYPQQREPDTGGRRGGGSKVSSG